LARRVRSARLEQGRGFARGRPLSERRKIGWPGFGSQGCRGLASSTLTFPGYRRLPRSVAATTSPDDDRTHRREG
jgi:hypothetical protein